MYRILTRGNTSPVWCLGWFLSCQDDSWGENYDYFKLFTAEVKTKVTDVVIYIEQVLHCYWMLSHYMLHNSIESSSFYQITWTHITRRVTRSNILKNNTTVQTRRWDCNVFFPNIRFCLYLNFNGNFIQQVLILQTACGPSFNKV